LNFTNLYKIVLHVTTYYNTSRTTLLQDSYNILQQLHNFTQLHKTLQNFTQFYQTLHNCFYTTLLHFTQLLQSLFFKTKKHYHTFPTNFKKKKERSRDRDPRAGARLDARARWAVFLVVLMNTQAGSFQGS
jgi:hypothetical protein